ncbi:hypothetical protein [Luteimonas deserti]|uniref:Glycine zipper domain-containing protein n=1 Tax=Luteimonas deserti TaxID=2752306 RepID=A0A7Z0QQ38_9GAMM|nr:hypothetical protein [Luteimonas deserti]NYZ62757.1 hypothetical protein [Luteimonas deserti]
MSNNDEIRDEGRDMNRDPITKAPGAHPVGVGVGGIAGGAAAGAAAGTIFGPVGTLIGAAVGVVAGAAVGKGVAERIDPTGETEYWREAHAERPYVKSDYDYDRDYAPAYGFGLQAREADRTRGWDESEATLREEWESARSDSRLPWDEAKPAVRDAWDRTERTHDLYQRSDAYHSSEFEKADYRSEDDSFDDYQPAYRYGVYARSRHPDRNWDDSLESELSRDWGSRRGTSKLEWDRAKAAVQHAYVSHDHYSSGQYSDDGRDGGDRFRVG